MNSQPMTFADRAAIITPYGIPVMPLLPRQKKAFLTDWQTLATTDADQIARWNKENPNSNCAAVARDGEFWTFDVDDPTLFGRIEKETGHSLDELDTLVVKSSGEKCHFYLKHDARSQAMGNVDGNDASGKELFSARSHNRYVVSPGSIHPDTGQQYAVLREPTFGEIPTAPSWLIDWILPYKAKAAQQAATAAAECKTISEGGRDEYLFEQACKLRDSGYAEVIVVSMLRDLNRLQCKPPMPDHVVEQKAKSAFKRPPREVKARPAQAETSVEPGAGPTEISPISADITPAYPSDTIDGDVIGELTRALTDGTFIPPQFMRENIKVALGTILDGYVGFPNHEDLHLRTYLHNVSVHPQSGKGESYKRTIAPGTGFLSELLRKFGVSIIDGGLFGSGEFMVKVLKDAPTHRSIARFDEMSEVWAKNRAIGCTLEKKFLTLFESTSAAQGSFKNGTNAADDVHLSLVGDFTKDSFDASFTGSGSRGSGYLSRDVFQFADKQPWTGDWQSIDTEKVNRVLSDIDTQITEVLSQGTRVVASEDADAKALRLEFYAWLDTQDARYTPRLKDHLKRDVLLRAVFGKSLRVPCGNVITAEMMRRSIEWCRNQLDNRTALFPEDAGSPAEIMERCILRVLTAKATASERELKRACHVSRAGSGGHEIFNRAIRSLLLGHEIKVVDKTRKSVPIYALFDAV